MDAKEGRKRKPEGGEAGNSSKRMKVSQIEISEIWNIPDLLESKLISIAGQKEVVCSTKWRQKGFVTPSSDQAKL
jgi:hypothetical protein